ncbi:MAG: YIP1 family protein [Erythrobacter sp.]|nr:MAG: YIP1 family protein [Erythrobacter sp.]
MEKLSGNIDSTALVSRAKGILLNPTTEWAQIATERDQPKDVFLRYALPLALISPIASFIGGQVFGLGGFGISISIGLMTGLTIAITSFVLSLVGLFIVAFAANFLSPKFGGRDDFPAAFRLVAYSWTAAWLAGIFGLLPALSILGILGLYSLYLLYKGSGPVMGVPEDKAVGYTVVTIVAAIVAQIIIGVLVTAITGPMLMANAGMGSGAIDIDMGEAGSMESNGDGTMTITGPDGEEVTITVDSNKSE